ncbi:DUF1801 domain-containing protein [Pseudoflavitalea sp. G-6-1-2]|nr:DUF1801 domain-containing protein [Pseudoflavitalea sp. G-6-1-2]
MDDYFLNQEEPAKSCLLALRSIILQQHVSVTAIWSYGMPTYCFKGKRFCYLWVHKKLKQPYIGIIDGNKMEHPALLQESRSRMKILLIDPEKDLPVKTINAILKKAISLLPQ